MKSEAPPGLLWTGLELCGEARYQIEVPQRVTSSCDVTDEGQFRAAGSKYQPLRFGSTLPPHIVPDIGRETASVRLLASPLSGEPDETDPSASAMADDLRGHFAASDPPKDCIRTKGTTATMTRRLPGNRAGTGGLRYRASRVNGGLNCVPHSWAVALPLPGIAEAALLDEQKPREGEK